MANKPRFAPSVIPTLLVAYGVPVEKAEEAAILIGKQVLVELAATANLLPKNVYEGDQRTDKISGFEMGQEVEDNWVISFGPHGGPGSLRWKDPEKSAEWRAKMEAKRLAQSGGPAPTDVPHKSRNANK